MNQASAQAHKSVKLDAEHNELQPHTPIHMIDLTALREHLKYNHGLLLMGAESALLLLGTHAHVHGKV